ncbi:MAG: hypothetical protein J4G13_04080 [Dehalococcoidia bacterium]|nr:hypothetical protein [Dehalococcoidia bacterium]
MPPRVGVIVQLGLLAWKVLNKLYRIYASLIPPEREALRNHLQALHQVLRDVAERRNEMPNSLPVLMMPPLETMDPTQSARKRSKIRFQERSRQFRQNARRTARTIREYQSSFTVEDTRDIRARLDEIRKILFEAERRSR